jgi:hypothetical protein
MAAFSFRRLVEDTKDHDAVIDQIRGADAYFCKTAVTN